MLAVDYRNGLAPSHRGFIGRTWQSMTGTGSKQRRSSKTRFCISHVVNKAAAHAHAAGEVHK